MQPSSTQTQHPLRNSLAPSSLLATLGIVYGDIGTSPLYAFKSCLTLGGLPAGDPATLIGLSSLLVWTLIAVVSLKYVSLMLRADSHGEGGILALGALCQGLPCRKGAFVILSLAGAALFFGDGIITPAISVLSALEGLALVSPALEAWVVPLAGLVVVAFFALQHKGSGSLGRCFGPVLLLWFGVLGGLGLWRCWQMPLIAKALNPLCALGFLGQHLPKGLAMVGGTILVVTGAEALYADLGHFGARAIRWVWHGLVFPALAVHYLGQGALLLRSPEALSNPFYAMAPLWMLPWLILLATAVTIIASQAVVSGVFSLGWQAMMLGYIPRLRVEHTSASFAGQVYVPALRSLLCALTLLTLVIFKSSDRLAGAYGLNVAATMLISSWLVAHLAYYRWHWPAWKMLLCFVPIGLIDTVFVAGNALKYAQGAGLTLSITACVMYLIHVWRRGSAHLSQKSHESHTDLAAYLAQHSQAYPDVLPQTAIFMSRSAHTVPAALALHLRHNKLRHRKILLVTVMTSYKPYLSQQERFTHEAIDAQTHRIVATYGFREVPSLHNVVAWCTTCGLLEPGEAFSCFVGRTLPVASRRRTLSGLAEPLFVFMAKNALPAYEFYDIPYHQVIELGIRYEV
jgi:KUP system potassium uptake protein